MIFLTIGTQLPFDRLVQSVDAIVGDIDESILAQIGETPYVPQNMKAQESLLPREFDEAVGECRLLVSHAGIGSVLTAQRLAKPIIIFPRQASFGEHRNDHQLATCKKLEGRPGIYVARTADDLRQLITRQVLKGPNTGVDVAELEIVTNLREHLSLTFGSTF